MMHARKLLLAFIFILFSAAVGFAQEKPPLKKLRWGVTSISASNWIPWIAKEAKIYEKNGLDMELILLRGSGQTSQAILGLELDSVDRQGGEELREARRG